jgi:hypothetical protein
VIWDVSKRPFLHGDIDFIGVDLGDYQGKEVQVRFEYIPSGNPETGYVIDDIIIIGKEAVDVAPYSASADTGEQIEADPGSTINMKIQLISKLKQKDEDVFVRIESVGCSDFLKLCRDVIIQPGIVKLPKDQSSPITINISLNLPSSSPSGDGWISFRTLGGGMVRDFVFHFKVSSRRNLHLNVTGAVSGPIYHEDPRSVFIQVQNLGNIEETVNLTFLTKDELQISGDLGSKELEPDEIWVEEVSFTIPPNAGSGNKTGFVLLSSSHIPPDALDRIILGNNHPDWKVFEVSYYVEQIFSVDLIAPSSGSTYREIEEIPDNGTEEIKYDQLIVRNLGNGEDMVSFTSPNWNDREDMVLILPDNTTVQPGETQFVTVIIRVTYPVPLGIYDIKIKAHSSGSEDGSDNSVDLKLSVGKAPVSSGIYLLNGSLVVRPTDLVYGREGIAFFTVRSFGFLDREGFNVNLLLNDQQKLTQKFDITQYPDKDCEIPVSFDEPGTYILTISLSEESELDTGSTELVRSMSTVVEVGYIDLRVNDINLIRNGDRVEDEKIKPGDYDVEVVIENQGNSTAPLAMIVLTIFDPEIPKEWNLTLNVTDISPNKTRELVFKNVVFDSERDYKISVSIENLGKWKDMNVTDDFKPMDIKVGSIPPDVPAWRDPLVGIIGFGLTFLFMAALLFYLIRRKL